MFIRDAPPAIDTHNHCVGTRNHCVGNFTSKMYLTPPLKNYSKMLDHLVNNVRPIYCPRKHRPRCNV